MNGQPPIEHEPKKHKLCVITDLNGAVVDISTEQANLSRGYTFPGYHEYPDCEDLADLRIGDHFDGVAVTPNLQARAAAAEDAANEAKVQQKLRKMAIKELKDEGEVPADYE